MACAPQRPTAEHVRKFREILLEIFNRANVDLKDPAAIEAARQYDEERRKPGSIIGASWAGLKEVPFADWPKYLERQIAAEAGLQQRRRLTEIRDRANRQLHNSRSSEWQKWQAEALKIWQQEPGLSKNAVAALVKTKRKLPDKPETIAGRIEKPPKAG